MEDGSLVPCQEIDAKSLRHFVEAGTGAHYWLHGARGSGKRQAVIQALLQSSVACDWALVSCSEHSDALSLARACCLQLLGLNHAVAPNSLSLLSQLLQTPSGLLESRVIVIVDDAQSWMHSPALREQLLAFARCFQPTHSHNASLFVIATTPIEVFARPELFSFVSIHFEAPSTDSVLVAALRGTQYWTSHLQINDFESCIINVANFVFENPLFDIMRLNVIERVRFFLMALDIYFEPLSSGETNGVDNARLFAEFSKRQTALFQRLLQHREHDLMPDLSIAAKMLLIAAYLVSSSAIAGRARKKGRAPRVSMAATLKPATLADILTTFKEIARGIVHSGFELKSGTSVPILAELADLVTLGLINKVGQKYQCATTIRTVEALSKTLQGFKLDLWH